MNEQMAENPHGIRQAFPAPPIRSPAAIIAGARILHCSGIFGEDQEPGENPPHAAPVHPLINQEKCNSDSISIKNTRENLHPPFIYLPMTPVVEIKREWLPRIPEPTPLNPSWMATRMATVCVCVCVCGEFSPIMYNSLGCVGQDCVWPRVGWCEAAFPVVSWFHANERWSR